MKSIDTLVTENSWQVEGLQKLLKNKKQQFYHPCYKSFSSD